MASDKYILVAAIDFGTTYSGYAFSTKHDFQIDPTKMSLVQWPAGTASMISQKASTCVLFKPDQSFHSFGYEAEDKYLELTLESNQEEWYLFRHFKLHLYNSRAGIKRDHRILCLEPEAASVFCKHIPVGQLVVGDNMTFQSGVRYMVIDAGGGTIDITVHEVQKEEYLRELVVANGGDCGGTKVDDAFELLLQDIIGKPTFDQFKSVHLYDLLDLTRSFEVKKKLIKENQSDKVTFSIPASTLSTYKHLHPGNDIKEVVAKNKQLSCHVGFLREKLQLSGTMAVSLFNQSITHLTQHIRALLRHPRVRDISAILMIGGYSECPLLIDAIRQIAGGARLVVPNEAGLAVLKGAVIIGHSPSIISERICKYTYGVEAYLPFNKGKHKKEYRVLGEGGKKLCKLAFDIFVKKGTAVKMDDHSCTKKYTSLTASQTCILAYMPKQMRNQHT